MSTTVLSSPKFKLIEGYEVTTSPQKPELSPLLNRGIPLINWVENKALLIEWRFQIPVASNSLSRPSIYHNKQYLKVRYCYNLLHQLPGSMKAVVKATCMYIRSQSSFKLFKEHDNRIMPIRTMITKSKILPISD